ncbi:MAG: anaerobic ribonucleoside-triphosphate reductase activating protein [Lachnospiraceae bacterium]|nr:anaerobic ribonucleoside-triphosphate reductase activating protein [Lachnospiraceae bacterium]
MNYSAIKYCDIANGTGVRTVLFVSGCRNHCKGCFQPETWDFCHGEPFTQEVEEEIIRSLQPTYIKGLTLLGGDPMEPENQKVLLPFIRKVKEVCPTKDIWAYTGYLVDKDLVPGGKCHTEDTTELLFSIDVLVDGPYIEEEYSIMLKFKGSANQRVIDCRHFVKTGEIVEIM